MFCRNTKHHSFPKYKICHTFTVTATWRFKCFYFISFHCYCKAIGHLDFVKGSVTTYTGQGFLETSNTIITSSSVDATELTVPANVTRNLILSPAADSGYWNVLFNSWLTLSFPRGKTKSSNCIPERFLLGEIFDLEDQDLSENVSHWTAWDSPAWGWDRISPLNVPSIPQLELLIKWHGYLPK